MSEIEAMGAFLILVRDQESRIGEGKWTLCPDGPFDTYAEARDFAEAEVGAKWMIVRLIRKEQIA